MVHSLRRAVLGVSAAGTLACGLFAVAGATPVSADYGNTAVRQVELSGNGNIQFHPGDAGGGTWLWIELSGTPGAESGSGTYAGARCGHVGGPGGGGGGAGSIRGDVTWQTDGTTLWITDQSNNFGGAVVRWNLGHYTDSPFDVFGIPEPGFVQVTVAP